MHGVSPTLMGNLDQAHLIEITLKRFRRTQLVCLIGHANMQSAAICLGIDGDGADAEFLGSSNNPNRNFAPIRNQQFIHSSAPYSYPPYILKMP